MILRENAKKIVDCMNKRLKKKVKEEIDEDEPHWLAHVERESLDPGSTYTRTRNAELKLRQIVQKAGIKDVVEDIYPVGYEDISIRLPARLSESEVQRILNKLEPHLPEVSPNWYKEMNGKIGAIYMEDMMTPIGTMYVSA